MSRAAQIGLGALGTVLLGAAMLSALETTRRLVTVVLVKDGTALAMSELERAELAERVEALMVGCGITSVSSPNLFAGRELTAEWEELRAGSHVYLTFQPPLRHQRSSLEFSEVAIGLENPQFVGPELTRNGDQVVGHVKCDGHRALALMCATVLRHHLLPSQVSNCAVYDRIGEPQ